MLKKLSLAALIAMGSMSVASATPLTEAIKGVDLSGMLRIRYYHEMPKDQNSYNKWRTNGIFIFKVPVDENIKLVYRASVQTYFKSDDDTANGIPTANNLKTLALNDVDTGTMNNLLFMAYSNNGLNAIIGKIPVKTSITSADPATPGHGVGAVATYTVNKNLTVAAGYVDAIRHASTNPYGYVGSTLPNSIYTAAAIFDAGVVKGQVWAYQITNVSDGIYTVTLNATPVEGVNAQVDYGHGKDNSAVNANAKSSNYYDVVLSGKIDQFCVKLGYAYHNDGDSVIITAADAPFGNVITTANNYNIAGASDKVSSIFGKIGANVDAKTSVYVAYQHQDDKSTANNDLDEYTVGAKYAYNKKMSFSGYYDYQDFKDNTQDAGEVRLEALYKF